MVAPRALLRIGATAALSPLLFTACAANSALPIDAGTILSTVIANLPRDGSRTTTTTTTSRSSTTTVHNIPSSPAATPAAAAVLRTGASYLGVRYVWGGNSPSEGFDCSGFTKYVFAKQGITLPRTSREQARVGRAVTADFRYLIPGDLMLFAEPGGAISHVAIYAGNGRILHASSSVGGVGYTDLNTGGEWFVQYLVAARRVE